MTDCPKCGKTLLENARYCTSCGFEESRSMEIFDIPAYREWDSFRTNDIWDRPYLEMDFNAFSTVIWSKAQFIILTMLFTIPLVLLIISLPLLGYCIAATIPSFILVVLLVGVRKLMRIGDRNLAWARALDEKIGHTPSEVGTIEGENPRYGRRI